MRGTKVNTDLLTRRRFLQSGAYAALAQALDRAPLLAAADAVRGPHDPIRSCILVIFCGGPSHLDTWDPKPQAAAEVRGEFRPISTNVPGRFVCEHLPKVARVVDRLAVIRSLHHPMNNHNAAMYEALVGRQPTGGDNEILGSDRKNDFPCYGSALLARRLVESGVRFVNVNDKIYNGQTANWDSHQDNFQRHRDDLLPPADQGFSALVEDLDQRGLLASTLVVAMGEFGRTPKINSNAGRDHWPPCYSVVLAGGGVAGGAAFGSSDRSGAFPETDPVTPGDLAATIYWRYGLDHAQQVYDPLGRPFRLADGQPIRELFPAA